MKIEYPQAATYPQYETLLVDMVEPNIMKVTLNRPKAYNALSHTLVAELTDLCERLKDDFYNVRVVLLYGGAQTLGTLVIGVVSIIGVFIVSLFLH